MKKILFCFVLLISVMTFGQQKLQNLKGSRPMKVTFMGKSPKLTAIKPIPNRTKATISDVYIVPNKLTKTGLLKQGPNSAPDPVIQKTTLQRLATSNAGQVLRGFDGGSNEDNAAVNGIQVAPPDTQGDVGPNHYIQMTNSVTTIFDKSGNTLFGPVPNSVFFQNLDPRLAGTNDGDPIVLYDQFADRWIVSQFAVSAGVPYAMLIAVSATSDPLGEYNQYAIEYGEDFPDYPKLGIWNDALYISTRDFPDSGGFQFSLVAINRADIIAGEETEAQRFVISNLGFDGILPADADGTSPPPAGEPHYSLFMGGENELNLISTSIDFENPANSTLEFGTVPVAPFSFFDTSVPQPNGQTLDVLPFFLMYRLQYMNFGTHASLLTNHSVQEVAGGPFGIRWYEFRDTGAEPWEVFQQGTFLPDDGLNRWMGSVAINENGDIALAYSVSSETLNPSIRFTGQSASETGTGILNIPETSILEGAFSSNGTNRWGDYSMMSIDPVDQDFWFTTEYIANDAAFSGWGTFISEMTFGDPPTAVCQDITLEFNAADGSISITPEQIDYGSIGPDGGAVTLSLDIDVFDCSNIGENTVTLTATSPDGISASCTATVTVNVIDVEPPVAVCQDIFVELGIDGSIEITPAQIDGGSTDNCSIVSLEVDESVFTELGTFPVTLTVTDVAGLTDTCEAIVTVAQGAEIVIDPSSISAAVDVLTDIPPVATESFLIANNGDVPLDFTTEIGVTETISAEMINALANLDRSIYTNLNKRFSIGSYKSVAAVNKELVLKNDKPELLNSSTVVDSLFYDTGIDFPTSFSGLDDGLAVSTGVLFVVDSEEFTLTSVRNAYATEAVQGANILLQIYAGGVTPDQGELLMEQIVTGDSETGVFALETLNTPLTFTQGESFWVVHSYPEGINFPQGQDDGVTSTVPGVYCFSQDGGQTFTLLDGFAFLTRALSEGLDGSSFITLSPENGIVQPGESTEVVVAFNGETLANGTYNSDLIITSNDSVTPTVTIPTSFTVSGQTSTIAVSDELLLFNDVFVGNSAERSLIISNTGLNALTISSITSDNAEFMATPSSATIATGEELEIVVSYTPEDVGSSNGIITITSDAANTSSFDVIVNGVGVEGPFAVLEPGQNVITLPQGESTNIDLTLSNDGGSPLIYSFPEFTMATAIANGAELHKAELIDFPSFSALQSKGFKDTRSGAPVPYNMGTDLEFGYTWLDSDEPGGPIPNFIDIVALGATDLTESLIDGGGFADGTVELALPFTIPFYGENQESLFVNANGFVAFENPTGTTFINGQIPTEDGVNNIIAPFWTDLEPGTGEGGTVHIAAFTDAIVVQWTDAPGFSTTGTVTFQVVLFSDGTIDVQYEDVSTASFLTFGTVGIENTGATDGAQVAFNTDFVKDNFAVRFMPPLVAGANFITAVTPLSGVLGVGQQKTITVTVDAHDLIVGEFLDELQLSSNTVNLNSSIASFELIVTQGPSAVLSPEFVQETVVTGESVQTEVVVRNDGGGTLNYTFPEFTMAAAIANGVELHKAELIDFPSFSAFLSKGFEDTRVGAPVPFSMGADLEFGYTWIDSDEPEGPIPNFIDIVALGATDLTASLIDGGGFADGTVEIPLPFTIQFYGENQESLFVNANGFVAFEAPTGTTFINGQIPIEDGVNNIVAPFWTDLEPGTGEGGTVHIAAFTDAIVVQWTDAPGFFTTGTVTFQVVLFSDGTIDLQYEDVSTASFLTNGTVGIENTGATDGAQVAFNTDFVKDDFAVRFIPPATLPGFITSVSSVSGSLEEGEEETITVTLDASDLVPEIYLDELVLSSNSIDVNESAAVFELTVLEAPEPELTFTLINANTNEAIGPLVDGTVIDLVDFNANSFSVIAVPVDMSPGSVVFDFNGINGFQIENIAPYALDGDAAGDFYSVEFPIGTNTITATPFSDRGGSGEAGIPLTVTFEVINAPGSDITSFTLINADINEEIGALNEGDIIDLADFNANSFSVTANTGDASVGSVIFDFNGVTGFQTENIAPYALDGDTAGNFNPVAFPVGTNTITATPFSGAVGSGSAGTPLTVTFEVIDIETIDSPENFGGYIYPNPVDDVTNFTLEDKSAKVLTGTLQSLYGGINQKFNLVTDKLGNGSIDMSTLPQGVYILQLKDRKGVLVSQLKIAKN